ncbi:Phosphate-regulating neutral endopeptidase [Strongyloides ratti]|uniref:Phosphate-regulating neutral endopeptidase n=1 Tax=Strongyloides ratti TaxID=34506 RepID=A0A090L4C5_STRRB|nr:Phosphate-regulating neutral endopeptidase [Strongyloides ratti]CEF62324.1 Phosphate-regulating neutral endopeptidase [Strongyloides ratti]
MNRIFIFFYIFIFLNTNICYGKDNKKNKVDLKATSKSLSKYVDKKKDPCNNFYDFACGNMIKMKKSKNESETNAFSLFIADLFDEKYYNGSAVLKKLSMMYNKCLLLMDEDSLTNCIMTVDDFGLYAYVTFFINHIESKKQFEKHYDFVKKMIDNIISVFKELIEKKDFLDNKTKKNYLKKIESMKLYKKHHENLKDITLMEECYKHFKFTSKDNADTMIKNMHKYANSFPKKDKVLRRKCIDHVIGKIDEGLPILLLTTENAFYDSRKNRYTINPMIFKDPYFDSRFPISLNYGSLGFVIGHELIHALDYININIDHEGRFNPNMTSWQSLKKYKDRGNCFVKQYGYEHKDIDKLDFEEMFTLKEDIADNGGIKLAHKAYKKHIEKKKEDKLKIPGFEKYTGEQLFFINYARFFCNSYRKNGNIKNSKSKVHNSDFKRIQNTLGNYEPFAKAFKCKKESKMVINKKCELW